MFFRECWGADFNLMNKGTPSSAVSESPTGVSLKWHVLIWAQESHELWHFDNFNKSGSVNIKVAPCLLEVGVHIFIKFSSWKAFVGLENFSGGSPGDWFVHPELSTWEIIFSLFFHGVMFDHWSHEDVITISCESGWDDSLVFFSSELSMFSSKEEFWTLIFVTFLELNQFIIRFGFLIGNCSSVSPESDSLSFLNLCGKSEEGSDGDWVFHVV